MFGEVAEKAPERQLLGACGFRRCGRSRGVLTRRPSPRATTLCDLRWRRHPQRHRDGPRVDDVLNRADADSSPRTAHLDFPKSSVGERCVTSIVGTTSCHTGCSASSDRDQCISWVGEHGRVGVGVQDVSAARVRSTTSANRRAITRELERTPASCAANNEIPLWTRSRSWDSELSYSPAQVS